MGEDFEQHGFSVHDPYDQAFNKMLDTVAAGAEVDAQIQDALPILEGTLEKFSEKIGTHLAIARAPSEISYLLGADKSLSEEDRHQFVRARNWIQYFLDRGVLADNVLLTDVPRKLREIQRL